jgi:hypothetical protein
MGTFVQEAFESFVGEGNAITVNTFEKPEGASGSVV